MKTIKRRIFGAVFVFLGIFLLVALITYSPRDPGWGSEGRGNPSNAGGLLGAYVASVFFSLLGLPAFLVPLFLVSTGIQLVRDAELKKKELVSWLLFLLGLSSLFGFVKKTSYLASKYPVTGGVFGFVIHSLSPYIGKVGVGILTLALFTTATFLRLEERPNLNFIKSFKFRFRKKRKPSKREVGRSARSEKDAKSVARKEEGFRRPSLELLEVAPHAKKGPSKETLSKLRKNLEEKLEEFGIEGEVVSVKPGPVITVFEFRPAPGIKINRIVSLADDLALGLSAESVRIVAPIPGKDVVGIEVSNPDREVVYLREIIASEEFRRSKSPLTLALGKDISGNPVVTDLSRMPHLLIAGATGTGKSVFLHSVILSLVYKATPSQVRLLLIDPKRIELSVYEDIPYLLHPVVLEPRTATKALRWAVAEMERRYQLLEERRARNLDSYNETAEEKLPYIVIIIDELADLMVVSSKEVETLLTRLAQMARASGIHLLLATQRPSVDVLTGIIKANFPARISFKVSSRTDSRTILDTQGAERLLGAGDMLFLPPGASKLVRIHGAYVSEKEVKRVVEFLREQGPPEYIADFEAVEEGSFGAEEAFSEEEDELYREAVKIAMQHGKISVSMLQRRLRIGYNRAARLVERMEEEGIVGKSDGVRPRPVLVGGNKP